MNTSSELVSNRRASYNYEILETFEAGIVLKGTEIKSLRDNGGVLQDAYVKAIGTELWLVACSIAPFKFGNVHNHIEKRDRKLLMHKREIARLSVAMSEKGLSVIPLSIFLKNGIAKVKLGLGKGKKTFDKRAALKERDEKKHMAQVKKEHG